MNEEDKVRYIELKLNEIKKNVEEKDKEIERLNNIIKRLEEDLREMYLTFGEFSEEYTENCIKKIKEGGDSENL